MSALFEQDFSEFLEPLVIGTMGSDKSSEGHITESWETKYNVDGVIQNMFSGGRRELSADTQVEIDYLILLPLNTSTGGEIELLEGYEVQPGSSYSSDVSTYTILEHDTMLDYVIEAEAVGYVRG